MNEVRNDIEGEKDRAERQIRAHAKDEARHDAEQANDAEDDRVGAVLCSAEPKCELEPGR